MSSRFSVLSKNLIKYGVPPSPLSIRIRILRRNSPQVFEFKGVISKVSITKELDASSLGWHRKQKSYKLLVSQSLDFAKLSIILQPRALKRGSFSMTGIKF
jgi:hypothetical protein